MNDNLTATLQQAQETYDKSQQSYEKINKKYHEAKQVVISAQGAFAGVQNIGDKTTIAASTQLLKSVQANLKQISANLLVARENVKAARINLDNTKKALQIEQNNRQPLKKVKKYTQISTDYGDIKLVKRAPHPTPNKRKKAAPVKMTRAEYRQQLNNKE